MKRAQSYPFLFVGQGFGTSAKCLEGYLWFEKAPTAKDQVAIVDLLPVPMLLGLRFDRDIAHFGSDDALEVFVIAAYDAKYKKLGLEAAVEKLEEKWANGDDLVPSKATWKAFCDHFERAMIAIHKRCKLVLAFKPDNGEYGLAHGPWHDWSITHIRRVVERALARRKMTSDLSFIALNLLIELDDAEIVRDERELWIRWIDRLIAEGDRHLKDDFVRREAQLVGSLPADDRRAELIAALRPTSRKKLAAALKAEV